MGLNKSLKTIKGYKTVVLFSLLACFLFSYCAPQPQEWALKSTEQVAGDYIANHAEYSEFAKLVEITGLRSLLNIRGPFTILLPNDSAMFAYYKFKNVNSLNDFTESERSDLVRYHIVPAEISISDIGFGALREPNAVGDYLATEFHGSDIYLNKYSKIIHQNIRTANGYIHVVDRVIDPVTKDVYSLLASNPSYSIFSEALSISGIKDTLQIVSFPYGAKIARTRYTLLAVPDTIYHRYGINDVNGLIAWCGSNSDSLTSKSNPFYRYVEYHCLNKSYFLSELRTTIYPILSHNNYLSMTISDDYKINLDPKTQKYTAFNLPESNIPAKNGVIHTVQGLLPVVDPEPAVIVCETTDYFDFQQEDCIGKYYKKWHDGQNSFESIKFSGDYLLYYYRVAQRPNLHEDCLSMLGYWWIEITTPKIMKGHYAVSAGIWTGSQDMPSFAAYVDGVQVAEIDARPAGTKMDFGEVTYTTTEEHKVKLVCTNWGVLFWDTIIFTPIK